MIIRLGSNTFRDEKEIIGVFDLDITSQSHLTRQFLKRAEKSGRVVSASEDLPKSFLVCSERGETTVYLSQMAASTLLRRAETGLI